MMWNPFKARPLPEIGSVWVLKSHIKDGNPFRKQMQRVRIKDVRNGWVNYAHVIDSSGLLNDESLKLWIFLDLYAAESL